MNVKFKIQNSNQPQNSPPEVLFPPPANTPPVDLQNNLFNFS